MTAPEQLSLPEVPTAPPIEPAMPSKSCMSHQALVDLAAGPLTTFDWVVALQNWKLGDAVHRLRRLGWQWTKTMVVANGRLPAQYELTAAHANLAARKLGEQQ